MGREAGDEYLPGGGHGTEEGDGDYWTGDGTRGDRGETDGEGSGPYYGIAVKGDICDGGATLALGSPDVLVEGMGVALEGDATYCPEHRSTYTIDPSTCAQKIKVNGKKVALCGYSKLTCGDFITDQPMRTVKGSPD